MKANAVTAKPKIHTGTRVGIAFAAVFVSSWASRIARRVRRGSTGGAVRATALWWLR